MYSDSIAVKVLIKKILLYKYSKVTNQTGNNFKQILNKFKCVPLINIFLFENVTRFPRKKFWMYIYFIYHKKMSFVPKNSFVFNFFFCYY